MEAPSGCGWHWRPPSVLNKLAICCTRPAFLPPEQWLERAAIVREGGTTAVADAALGRWFTERFHVEHPDVVDAFRTMLVETPTEGYASCCEALATFDVRSRLGAITAPTLVVTGEVDPVAPPGSGAELAAAIPGATHVAIAGAAHIANVEQPQAFTKALRAHLDNEIGDA